MKIEGISEQNGIPTPEYPIPIKVGQKIVVKDKNGNVIGEIPFNAETMYKEGVSNEWRRKESNRKNIKRNNR